MKKKNNYFESIKSTIVNVIEDIEYASDTETFNIAFESHNGITVSSIYGVKGAEYDTVIAFALLEGIVPHFTGKNPRESAKKLLYIIGSRARKIFILFLKQEEIKNFLQKK